MTLEEFLHNYGGNACISIDGYCEEEYYDIWTIAKESWWNEVKDKKIKHWNVIGGDCNPVEIIITLMKSSKAT